MFRRPTGGESEQNQSHQQHQTANRQQTPPIASSFGREIAESYGADASAIAELIKLHTDENDLINKLKAVRHHMDVNRLYIQRLSPALVSLFGIQNKQQLHLSNATQPESVQENSTVAEGTDLPESLSQMVNSQKQIKSMDHEILNLKSKIDMLENIKGMLETQHEQELDVLRKSYQRQIDELEQAARLKEERLKQSLSDVTDELEQTRKRHLEIETERQLNHKSELDRLNRERDDMLRQMSNRHRQEMADFRRAHEEQVEMLRQERRSDAAAAGAAPELKNLADHLQELENSVHQRQENTMSLRMTMFSDREGQMRNQEIALAREREQIRQALNQMEQAKNELLQQRWLLEQKEAKVQALQQAVEDERKRLTESSERDRSHIDKMRSEMIEEHSRLLGEIFKEKQKVGQESERVEAEHRKLLSLKSEAQHQQIIAEQSKAQAKQAEEHLKSETEKLMKDRDNLVGEVRRLDDEKQTFMRSREEIDAKKRDVERRMIEAEQIRRKGEQLIEQSENLRDETAEFKRQLTDKEAAIEEMKNALSNDQTRLHAERVELEKLKRSFICTRCSRNVGMEEVKRVVFENSPQFASIRERVNALEPKFEQLIHEAERDPNSIIPRKSKKNKALKPDELDYEAEKAWLDQICRYRIQSSS